MGINEVEELFVDIYPCSCGHCTECGRNFVATPEEKRRWAQEEADPQWVFEAGEWIKQWQ